VIQRVTKSGKYAVSGSRAATRGADVDATDAAIAHKRGQAVGVNGAQALTKPARRVVGAHDRRGVANKATSSAVDWEPVDVLLDRATAFKTCF